VAVTPNNLNFPQTPRLGRVQFDPADGTAWKTIITAGAYGSKIVGISLSSYDPTTRQVLFSIGRAGGLYQLGTLNVTLSGVDQPPVDAMTSLIMPGLPIDNDGQRYIYLEPGDTLQCLLTSAITAGRFMQAFAFGADFGPPGSGNSLITPQTPKLGLTRHAGSVDPSETQKTIITAGANGAKLVGLTGIFTETVLVKTVRVYFSTRSGGFLTASQPVFNAGVVHGISAHDFMSRVNFPSLPLDNDGQPYLLLEANDIVRIWIPGTPLSAGAVLEVAAIWMNF
jgi:hypothetical protein